MVLPERWDKIQARSRQWRGRDPHGNSRMSPSDQAPRKKDASPDEGALSIEICVSIKLAKALASVSKTYSL
jgi:hypothetical protein